MKRTSKVKTTERVTLLITFEDLRKAFDLPESSQIFVTLPEECEEKILFIEEGKDLEAEYTLVNEYSNDQNQAAVYPKPLG